MILELDVELIVDLLQKEDCNQNGIDALVSNCKSGLREIPLVQIHHCYREADKCADALARRGALLPQNFVVFLDPHLMSLFYLVWTLLGWFMNVLYLLFSFNTFPFLPKIPLTIACFTCDLQNVKWQNYPFILGSWNY